MNSLDRIVVGVSEAGTINASLEKLLWNISSEMKLTARDEDTTVMLGNLLTREAEHLARCVVANTPMITGTPALHPVPEARAPEDEGPRADEPVVGEQGGQNPFD